MADESTIGTARIDVTVNTATMEAGVEAAKRKVSGLGTQASAEFDKASASTKRYAESLARQAELLGKSRAEQIAYNAQTRIGGQLGDEIARKALANQAKLAAGMGATAKSAKELQFAMRGVPAQITDIFTSLASGQRPMMVLLQQGGQLKDMFGGIKPAAAALGRSLLGLINPYTLAAGAAAGLAAALVQAENDASAFNKALIVTGNYAGKTATQLEGMVDSIARTADVTEGTAREALQKVAESGRFTGEQFDLVATAAARMSEATGQSIDDIIQKFVDLGKKPVETLLKLNETEHFLTQAQLDRVEALKAEGKEQETAAEAARIYATRLDDVATAAEAARPALSRMWKEAKEGASGAWEETKKFADFLAAAAEKYKEMPWYKRLSPAGGFQASVSALYGAEPNAPVNVKPVAGAIDSEQARKAIKAQEEAAKKSAPKSARPQSDFFTDSITGDTHADLTASIGKEIDGYKKEADQWARSTSAADAYKRTLDDMLETRQRAIDLQVQSIGMGQREAEQQQALIAIDQDYNRKKAELQRRQQDSTSQLDREGYQQQLDALEKYHTQRIQMEVDGWKRAEEARKNAALGARAAIKDFEDAAGNVAGQTYDVFSNAFDGMADAIANFVTTGKLNFADLTKSILADLAKMEARILISQALQALFSGVSYGGGSGAAMGTGAYSGFGSSGTITTTYNAKGGVYDSPSLSAYSGGVYDKPQLFAFAKGAGVFAEAGPEAIMPLRRGPDGKLGVAASGGGGSGDVQISQTFVIDGSGGSEQTKGADDDNVRKFANRMKDTARQVILEEQRPGGALWAMRQPA